MQHKHSRRTLVNWVAFFEATRTENKKQPDVPWIGKGKRMKEQQNAEIVGGQRSKAAQTEGFYGKNEGKGAD